MVEDFSMMSLSELREEAKKKDLKGISAMRKQELIDLLATLGKEEVKEEQKKEEQIIEETNS